MAEEECKEVKGKSYGTRHQFVDLKGNPYNGLGAAGLSAVQRTATVIIQSSVIKRMTDEFMANHPKDFQAYKDRVEAYNNELNERLEKEGLPVRHKMTPREEEAAHIACPSAEAARRYRERMSIKP